MINDHMNSILHRIEIFFVALLVLSGSTSFAADTVAALFNGKDLSGWKTPAGDWQTAKAVSLDPANEKKFAIEPGEGVLVNGPKGTTQNLVTQLEYADAGAQ